MNKKLQSLVDEFSRELQSRFPGVALEVYPRHPKSAYVYVTAPENSKWEGDGVWDIVDSMSQKEVDTLVKTGYSILLLPRLRPSVPSATLAAILREKPPVWDVSEDSE